MVIFYKEIKGKYYATSTFNHVSNIVSLYGTLVILASFTIIEKFHERVIRFIHSDNDTDYPALQKVFLRYTIDEYDRLLCFLADESEYDIHFSVMLYYFTSLNITNF